MSLSNKIKSAGKSLVLPVLGAASLSSSNAATVDLSGVNFYGLSLEGVTHSMSGMQIADNNKVLDGATQTPVVSGLSGVTDIAGYDINSLLVATDSGVRVVNSSDSTLVSGDNAWGVGDTATHIYWGAGNNIYVKPKGNILGQALTIPLPEVFQGQEFSGLDVGIASNNADPANPFGTYVVAPFANSQDGGLWTLDSAFTLNGEPSTVDILKFNGMFGSHAVDYSLQDGNLIVADSLGAGSSATYTGNLTAPPVIPEPSNLAYAAVAGLAGISAMGLMRRRRD